MSRDVRALFVTALVTVVIATVAACGSAATPSTVATAPTGSQVVASPSQAPVSQSPVVAEKLTVAVQSLGSENWSPWLASQDEEIVTQHVFDTLVRVDPATGELVPGLAESWALSDDLKTWTFKLRPDVPFHDGYGMVTAEDVKFSWEQLIREDSAMAQAPLLRQAIGGDIANFNVSGPLEFSVTATDPLLILSTQLTDQGAGLLIQSKKYWDEKGEAAAAHPVGTGPFKFVSSTAGVGATLEAVDDHPFRATPSFRTVDIRIIGDNATRLAAVQSGDVDLAPITPQQVEEARAAGLQIRAAKNVGLVNMILGGTYPDHANFDATAPWIQASDPAKGLAVRQALSLAIDRKAIIDRVYAGEGEPAACPLVCYPGFQWTDSSIPLPAYDPALARQKLTEGGFPNGFTTKVWTFEQSGRPGTGSAGEAVAGMWEAIGLTVEREPVDFANFLPQIQNRTTSGHSWIYITPFYADPAVGVQVAYAPTSTRAHFNDPAINAALAALSSEPDRAARYELIKKMSLDLAASTAAIPLFTQVAPYAAGDTIAGWTPIPGVAKLSAMETITP